MTDRQDTGDAPASEKRAADETAGDASVKIDADLWIRINDLAKLQGVPVGRLVNEIVARHLRDRPYLDLSIMSWHDMIEHMSRETVRERAPGRGKRGPDPGSDRPQGDAGRRPIRG